MRIKAIVHECICGNEERVDLSSKKQEGNTLNFTRKICLKCGRVMAAKIDKG